MTWGTWQGEVYYASQCVLLKTIYLCIDVVKCFNIFCLFKSPAFIEICLLINRIFSWQQAENGKAQQILGLVNHQMLFSLGFEEVWWKHVV